MGAIIDFLKRKAKINQEEAERYGIAALSKEAVRIVEQRMAIGWEKGRYSWWDENVVSDYDLQHYLEENLVSGDFDDVAVYAMMLYFRRSAKGK